MVVREAMAARCPVITANTHGLREVVPVKGVGFPIPAQRIRSISWRGQFWKDPVGQSNSAALTRNPRTRVVADSLEHFRRFDYGDVAAGPCSIPSWNQPWPTLAPEL